MMLESQNEMPGIIRRSRIGIVDVTDIEDNENSPANVRWCLNCEEAGAHSKLGPRKYLPENEGDQVVIPEDADEWLQCPACGTIIARHESRGEGELQIDSEFELVETPFDFGKAMIEGIHSSRRIDRSAFQNQAKKKQRVKMIQDYQKDPDIQNELKEGGTIESYDVIK